MLPSLLAIASGLVLLLWSAERFVASASAIAGHFGMPPLLIGMLVIGFGTSAPEMTVSVLSAATGNTGIALGNAYGSNITNIALILGVTALIAPIAVHSRVVRVELPALLAITALAGWQLLDGTVSRTDALLLLLVFALLLAWTLWTSLRRPDDTLADDIEDSGMAAGAPGRNAAWLLVGLLVLIASSRLLVWGAVDVAEAVGLSQVVIGLTVVAIGTSLPELASSLTAARRGEHDLAVGNVVGSNLFNTLVVVGLAGIVRPLPVPATLIQRDLPVMIGLTVVLLLFCYGFRGPGRINRLEGAALAAGFIAFTTWLLIG
ncbi:MAG: calcium/sodium antiporter [Candidatus Wenzhouxiangella sp. M2_3B_020]